MAANLKNILYVLNNGGVLRFVHNSGLVILVDKDGREYAVDGRSYQGFVAKSAKQFKRTEIGSLESTTLVIQWQK